MVLHSNLVHLFGRGNQLNYFIMLEGLKKLFSKKQSESYPAYFRHGNTYVKATGPNSYIKSFVSKDGFHGEMVGSTSISAIEIFSKVNKWETITETEWIKHLAFVSAPKVSGRTEKPIKFVFECAGRQYFTFDNHMDFPAGRFREMEIVMVEYEARASREYLLKAFNEIVSIIDNPKELKVSRIAAIAKESLGRMNLLFDFGLYEKIASVMYFDEAEDISTYDPGYNEQKIKLWRDNGGVDFFLKMPIRNLLPFGQMSREDFLTFLKEQTAKLKLIQAGLPLSANDA